LTNSIKLFLISILFLGSTHLTAIPRFGIKEGSCNTCHVNPTGGGLRNDYASLIISTDELPLRKTSSLIELDDPGQLTDHIRIGADLRAQLLSDDEETIMFPMQADLYANIDMNGLLDIYVEQEALLGIMEYWSNVFIPFINAFIKVGKMRPNYGLGIDDHTSFIRGGNITRTHGLLKEGLPFSPIRPTVNSAELGFFGTNYLLTGSISNAFLSGESSELAFLGLPDNRTIVLRGEYSLKSGQINGLIGGSYLAEKETFIRGVFGGLSKNSFTYTGEVDLVTGWSGDFTGLASFSEIAWVPRQGIHLLLKYDFLDENIELINNSLSRLSLGLEVFPFNFMELKVQIRKTGLAGKGMFPTEFLFQTHFWF